MDHGTILARATDIRVNTALLPRDLTPEYGKPQERGLATFSLWDSFSQYSENMPIDERVMIEALLSVLPPDSVALDLSDRRVDAVAVLPDGSRQPLDLKWAGEGYPRDVERVLGTRTRTEPGSTAASAQTVVVARALTRNAADALRARGLSWVTLDGYASLRLGTVWVERGPRAEPTLMEDVEFSWSPARLDIAEATLAACSLSPVPVDERPTIPRVEDLKRWSGRSLGAVAKALADFDRLGWTGPGASPRSRVLRAGSEMLETWSAWSAAHLQPWAVYHSLHRDPGRIVATLLRAFGDDICFTGLPASQLLVPVATDAPVVSAYLTTGREGWHGVDRRLRELDIRPSATGAVRLAAAPRVVAAFASEMSGFRIASPVRVYADLLAGFSREREAAEVYRTAALGSLG